MQFFKHYHNASSSLTIQKMIKDHGLLSYAHWFLFLEIACEKFDGVTSEIEFSLLELSQKLKIKPARVRSVLGQFSSLVEVRHNSDDFILKIDCPILLDLQDKDYKYSANKRRTNGAKNKIKNKDKEEDKDKEEIFYPVPFENNLEPEVNFQKLADLFNRTIGANRKEYTSLTWCPNNLIQELHQTLAVPEFQKLSFWEKYFEKTKNSDYLNGKTRVNFKASLLWLIKLENAYKVLNGQYDNGNQQSNSGISDELKAQMDQRAREYDEAIARGEAV